MCLSQQQIEYCYSNVRHDLFLYSKRPRLVEKGNTISVFTNIFLIHFLLREMSLILRKKGETNPKTC